MKEVFFYKRGSLDNSINHFADLNDLYRLHDDDLDFKWSMILFGSKINSANVLFKRNVVGLEVNLVPNKEKEKSLVLEGNLLCLDGTVYQGYSYSRHNLTVRKESRSLIEKHGEFHVKELQERFNDEFGSVLEEDYCLYEILMFEFFLKNLPLLNAYDLRPQNLSMRKQTKF